MPALVLALAACAAAPAFAQASAPDPAARMSATPSDAQQRARWGDLAPAAGRTWLFVAPGEIASVWRDLRWVEPGVVLKYHRGFCIAGKCEGTEYLVRWNGQGGQLEFRDGDKLAYTGRVQDDGSVRISGAGLLGALTAETVKLDPATGTFFADKHELKPATTAQLAEATGGFAGSDKVAQATPAAPAPAQPASAASSAAPGASEAELRAELAAMKARVDALSRQVEQQKPMTAAEKREAERAARAKAAEEARLAREAKAREEAERRAEAQAKAREEQQRRAEAQARAREEALARAAEQKRLAEEKRLQAAAEAQAALEAKKRAAEETKRAAEEKAAEAQRLAEARRAASQGGAAAAGSVQAAAAKPAARAVSRGESCGGSEGLYGTGANYRIEVSFEGDTVKIREPNRVSVYEHLGQCQFGFTHPNGTQYRMGVARGTLVAYKQGMDPSQGTPLDLLQARAAPQANGQCKAEAVSFQNPEAANPGVVDKLYGIWTLGDQPARVEGVYRAPERDGRPQTELKANGEGGTFEVYGAPNPEYVYRIRRWWIQANCDGTPVVERGAAGSGYLLIMQLDRPYQGRIWHRNQIAVSHNEDRMFMLDRVKRKTGN